MEVMEDDLCLDLVNVMETSRIGYEVEDYIGCVVKLLIQYHGVHG